MVYKLRTTLVGHEEDVRGVTSTIYPIEGIATVSRDQSCRVWAPKAESIDFKQEYIFYGHTKYVSSVCVMPPSDKHPNGLIITGGNDNIILVHEFDSPDPIYTLSGHSSAVVSLDTGNYGTILSGSWDKLAKVWINGKEVFNLSGHEGAVWGVKMLPDKGLMLTASADKTIKLWKAGKCERTFIGHTDCVRGLAVLPTNEFLSCSNDGTVRKWLLSGECVHVFKGHTNYIYSIALIPGTETFVTSGEDRTVRVWKDGECEQTITLPSQSVWSVGALENGDIFAGSSDSLCRVFSKDPSRQASPEALKEFEETVANQAIPAAANLDLGEIKVDQLAGPEALLQPGMKADQTKLIKNNGIVEAYQWDANSKEWKKIGEVTGAAGEEGSKRTSGKTSYQGKEYDFVFDVDIQEGAPPLKLPYNVTEDPWVAAHNFLQKNDISPMFLDQVANFIIKNTEGITLGQGNPQYQDPFTGSGRYVPGSTSSNGSSSTGAFDPFTGAGRYVPPQSQGSNVPAIINNNLFPETKFLRFSTGKYEQISSKIREFNGQIEQNQLTENQLQVLSDSLNNLLKGATQLHNEVYNTLSDVVQKFSQWPNDKLVPVLDSIRVLVLNETFCTQLFSDTNGEKFIDSLVVIASTDSVANSMLVFRIFTNVFIYGKASFLMYQKRETILECCLQLFQKSQHKNLRIALSSYLVNTCIYCRNISSSFEDSISLCTLLHKFLSIQAESEAVFRQLIALGTLIYGNDDLIAFVQSLELPSLLKEIQDKSTESKKYVDEKKGALKKRVITALKDRAVSVTF